MRMKNLITAGALLGAAAMAIEPAVAPRGKYRGGYGRGACKISEHSGLRKLMRAARRGKIPAERMGIIKRAMASAGNGTAYLNSHARRASQVGVGLA